MIMERRFLWEEGEDDNATPTPSIEGEDSGGDTGNEDTSDAGGESNEDQTIDDSGGGESTEEDTGEDENFDIDAEPDAEEDTSDDAGEGGDESGDDSTDDTSSSDTPAEENELDKELFDSLTDSEKQRKIATLKRLYMDLYTRCDVLVDKFNQMSEDHNDDFKPVIKRILTILYDLKEYIGFYVLNVFDKASYIENDITFNRYLAVLNGIKLTVEELYKVKIDEEDKK